uniref:EGF-like domain-containing protein n=1 Tax=Magallana gigas TaxID=29159 RepID=A0A8W8K1L9_MAGGI
MDSHGIVIVLLPFLAYTETSVTSECFNNKTGVNGCCQDYRNVSGKCEACIGSWGTECRKTVHLVIMDLDVVIGAIVVIGRHAIPKKDVSGHSRSFLTYMKMLTAPLSTTPDLDLDDSTNTEASLLVASGLLILLLLCVLLIGYKKMKKQSEPIQRCAGQKVIYDDLNVSRIVDNGGEYDIPACIDNSNKTD